MLDTSGIQGYVFGTNNLKQNAGASYLADCVTRRWVKESLDQVVPGKHNILDFDDVYKPLDTNRIITDNGVDAEVIYAGGGNTALLFKTVATAKAFTTLLSRKVLVEAPDLTLVIAHQEFDWDKEPLGSRTGIIQSVIAKLQATKQGMPASQPLRGLGVTVDCVFTYRPAVGYDQQNRPLSAESWAKLCAEPQSHDRLLDFLDETIDRDLFNVPRDFEEIGGSHEESSYIAVVHADGNGIGKRIEAIQQRFSSAKENSAYVQAMRAFSISMQAAADKALNATIRYLVANIAKTEKIDRDGHPIYAVGDTIELKNCKIKNNDEYKWGKPYLPFRPFVFGGDDVTFVCEGRLGLQLAAYYLEKFSACLLDDKEPAYCRAGVAVTHSHYPFALAYELADALCQNAKKAIARWKDRRRQARSFTALDWHFAVNGMNLSLGETRVREYTSDGNIGNLERSGDLLMRPIRLDDPDLDWHTWSQFQQLLKEFHKPYWQERHNKVIALREPLRQGPKAVEQFRLLAELKPLPEIEHNNDMETTGWQGKECGYFDAIEALDFYVPLRDEVESEAR